MRHPVFAIAKVKDEADVIERTVRHMLGQVDQVIVADNASTDGTREILEQLPVELVDLPAVAHYQARDLTALAHLAHQRGARWVVPFDADELVYARHGRVADVLRAHKKAWIFTVDLFDHVPTELDGDGHPFDRMGWRHTQAGGLLKIACRTANDLQIGEGSHTCDYAGDYPEPVHGELVTRHFPVRSVQQFIRKAVNGSRGRGATDLPDTVSGHLREYGRIHAAQGEDGLEALYRERFLFTDPEEHPDVLVYDPV